jgi:Ca-activated chloride channel family protein
MEWAAPWALLLALIVFPAGWLLWWRGRRGSGGVPLGAANALVVARPNWRLRAARLLPVLRLLAMLLVVAGLARPRSGNANAVVKAEGVDIALALDVSSSMTTSSLGDEGNRLEVTKRVVHDFIDGRENDRIGLVVFERDAIALAPLSLDYTALKRIVDDVDSGIIVDGTGIGVGLSSAVNMLIDSSATSRVVILLTDGKQNANSISPLDAADLAAALHIRVYTIGVVSPDSGTQEVDTDLLQEIATETNARYFVAATPQDLEAVYDEIGSLERSRVGREHFESFTEYGPWLIGAGAGLLAIELLLGATWLRRTGA